MENNFELVPDDHPLLTEPATVDPITSGFDLEVIERGMFRTMHLHDGLGLASNQVGMNLCMFVMTHSELGDIAVYNPRLLSSHGWISMEEGCLTWPMLFINKHRPFRIEVRYSDRFGDPVVQTLYGIDARCFLHELDHLHGITMLDDIGPVALKRAKDKRDKRLKKLARRKK